MTDKFEHIRNLARDRALAGLYLHGLGMANRPTDIESQVSMDAQYQIALDALRRIDNEYRKAMDALDHADLLELVNGTGMSAVRVGD
jgi:hypothetical protein